jgi:hypothetical protein
MKEKPYMVHVIVDPAFGQRLREIPVGEPIWIADTEVNRPAYKMVETERNPESYLVGLTCFKVDAKNSPEDWLISEIATIDLHHGEMSHAPPWSIINVIGAKWSNRIRDELAKFGFDKHEDTADGFKARMGSVSHASDGVCCRRLPPRKQ